MSSHGDRKKDKSIAEKQGPGFWVMIHYKSLYSSTNEFQKFIKSDVMECFPCLECIKHLEDFCKNHPFHNYENIRDKDENLVGMFQWSWALHNSVNIRLGKSRMDYETCYNIHKNKTYRCHDVCTN
jgi:hypothetical protein